MDDLISVRRGGSEAHGSRLKPNIFTGWVVFTSCCSDSSTSPNILSPRGRTAHRCLPPKHSHPKHLIFRLSASEQQMERLKGPDVTSARSSRVMRERAPCSSTPELQQRITFLGSLHPRRALWTFFFFFAFIPTVCQRAGKRTMLLNSFLKRDKTSRGGLSFNEFVSFALI